MGSEMCIRDRLYEDAELTLPHLHDLVDDITKKQPAVASVVAPLKGEERATYKTLDKYQGGYSRLTDLARMCVQPTQLLPCASARSCPCHCDAGLSRAILWKRCWACSSCSATTAVSRCSL